ncbi:hypothetical protein [Desulforamulus hydrothermalis]|nr:hypothetical protein [Desulforamulus hydrothermalis]
MIPCRHLLKHRSQHLPVGAHKAWAPAEPGREGTLPATLITTETNHGAGA